MQEVGTFSQGRWLPEEHQKFIEAILKYGNEWINVQKYIGTRSITQARSHAQKFFTKLKKTDILTNTPNNSIKLLHNKMNEMEEAEYNTTLNKLNKLAFERKNSISRKNSGVSCFSNILPSPSSIKTIEIKNIDEFLNLDTENPVKKDSKEEIKINANQTGKITTTCSDYNLQ